MKAAVAWSSVFASALRALGECPHAGTLSIIWQRLDDREARATVGARNERVAVPPVGGVEELGLTCSADARIGRNRLPPVGVVRALKDGEVFETGRRDGRHIHPVDAGQGRRLLPQGPEELFELGLAPLHLDLDLTGGVANPARQLKPQRQPVNKRPEPHALYDTADIEVHSSADRDNGLH
jgi:hypothetical protein